jgi:hypothetical protein
MPSPFPGMNPYLEQPDFWAEVHHRLITAIAIAIAPSLRPKYRVAIEKRTYLSDGESSVEVGIPDVAVIAQNQAKSSTATIPAEPETMTVTLPVPEEIREGYLEIREVATGRVVTAIEILSPTNKRNGRGRDAYEEKRREVLTSATHLVEIDLLRSGQPMQMTGYVHPSDYRILVSRREQRPQAQLHAFSIRQSIPQFYLPLQTGDVEPMVDLQAMIHEIYDQAGFDLTLNYQVDPMPGLAESDRSWLDVLLKEQALR